MCAHRLYCVCVLADMTFRLTEKKQQVYWLLVVGVKGHGRLFVDALPLDSTCVVWAIHYGEMSVEEALKKSYPALGEEISQYICGEKD